MNQDIKRMVEEQEKKDSGNLGNNDDVRKLLEENLEMTREVYRVIKKVNRSLIWQQVFGFLKVLIIVVPIILGVIYLPPILKGVFDQYQQLLNSATGVGDATKNLNLDGLRDILDVAH